MDYESIVYVYKTSKVSWVRSKYNKLVRQRVCRFTLSYRYLFNDQPAREEKSDASFLNLQQ